jgi:hypothetical protein
MSRRSAKSMISHNLGHGPDFVVVYSFSNLKEIQNVYSQNFKGFIFRNYSTCEGKTQSDCFAFRFFMSYGSLRYVPEPMCTSSFGQSPGQQIFGANSEASYKQFFTREQNNCSKAQIKIPGIHFYSKTGITRSVSLCPG